MVIREMQCTIMTVLVGLGFAFLLHMEEAPAAPLADKHFVSRYTDSFRTDAQFDPALAWLSAQASRDVYNYSFEELRLNHRLGPPDFQTSLHDNGFREIQFVSYADPATWNSPLGNDLSWSDWMDKFLHPTTAVDKASALGQFAEASLQAVVASRSIVVDGRKKNVVAIVFRGTEGTSKDGIPDWLVNAAGNQVPFSATDPLVLVHEGFLTAMQKFVAKSGTVNIGASSLAGLVQVHSADTIFWISGHSLGGAIATLYGAWLEDQGVSRDNIVIYTFGAPLVGNDHFRYVYFQECLLTACDATGREFLLTKKLNLHRARNHLDPVPYAPYFQKLVNDIKSSWQLTPKVDLPSTLGFGKLFASSSAKALASLSSLGYDALVRTADWPYQPVGYQHILEWNSQGQLLDYTNNPTTNFIDRWRTITFPVDQGIGPHSMDLYTDEMMMLKARTPSVDVLPSIGISPQPSETPFADAVDITLATDPGVTLYYTLDGSTPKVSDYPSGSGMYNGSPVYTGPIHLVYTGWGPSQQISMRVMAVAADGSTANTHERIYRLSAKNLDVTTQSYLQIIAPDRQLLALDGADHSFYAAAGQVLELKLMNWSNAPLGFTSLGGKPRIFVLQNSGVICPGGANYNGNTVRCELTVSAPTADGTVQLTFPSAGYYQLLAVAYATGGGESLLVYPIVATEPVSQPTGGTGGTGTTATVTRPLNDTGITGFAGLHFGNLDTNNLLIEPVTHPRQDARYGRDAQAGAGKLTKIGGGGKGFDYSKIANNGTVLPESAVLGSASTDWACTRDNVTGLIWEVKTPSGLRSQSHTYTWYNSNPATNGGAVGTASGGACFATGKCDTEKFVADINASGLCGASDWRMPKVNELVEAVDYGRTAPKIDPTYFPNTPSSYFWSSSTSLYSSGHAEFVDLASGGSGVINRSYSMGVRLVRDGSYAFGAAGAGTSSGVVGSAAIAPAF